MESCGFFEHYCVRTFICMGFKVVIEGHVNGLMQYVWDLKEVLEMLLLLLWVFKQVLGSCH